jgi:putative ABC transport system permease protein
MIFRNYIKIAIRSFIKNRPYSFMSLGGLSIGMAVAILIGLWVWDEISFDNYFTDHKRLTSILSIYGVNGVTGSASNTAVPVAAELRTKYPNDLRSVAICSEPNDHKISIKDKAILASGNWVQEEFPEMFTLKMVQGDRHALNDPSAILITQSLASSLFGDSDPIEKIVTVDDDIQLKVKGVFEDLPANTTLSDIKLLLPWNNENNANKQNDSWNDHHFQVYVEVRDPADIENINKKIKNLTQAHLKRKEQIALYPMDKWHLYNEFSNGKISGGRIQIVWLFGVIGIFVLVLACINFMNLSTARSERRAKEVGIRKAIGSSRSQITFQMLGESVATAFFAFLFAILIDLVLLPYFNSLANKLIGFPWGNVVFWLLGLVFIFLTGIIAGTYPAFYLSGFKPIKVLKGISSNGNSSSALRKILVVFQFAVSVALIIGTIIVFRQVRFTRNRPAGYDFNGLITLNIHSETLVTHFDALRKDLMGTGMVEEMAESSSRSTEVRNHYISFNWRGKDPNEVPVLGVIFLTPEFGKTIKWELKNGRDFSRDFPSDSDAIILNESAVALTGLKSPIGDRIEMRGMNKTIIGVIKDMVMESPYQKPSPTVFILDSGELKYITIRISRNFPVSQSIARIKDVFKTYDPGSPFDFAFVDKEFGKKFLDEERIGRLAFFFTVFAIFISCLGLFGLASYVAQQRTKEIGVRKVLGASTINLWAHLTKDFLLLVILSCVIATPIAWYFLDKWLSQFVFRTKISWLLFIGASLCTLVIAFLTVSYHTFRAASAAPAKSLRSEG